jgi:hypothetical protein
MMQQQSTSEVSIHTLARIRPVLCRGCRLGLRRVESSQARKTPPVWDAVEFHPIDGENLAALVSRE